MSAIWIFKFYDDRGQVHWKSPLFKKKCKTCKRNTSFVHPTCLRCTVIKFHVDIRKSSLGEKVGKGLFAFDPRKKEGEIIFNRGDFISPYMGETVKEKTLQDRYCTAYSTEKVTYVTSPYAFQDDEKNIFDAALFRGPAAYANDARGSKKRNNSNLMSDEKGNIGLYANKRIKNGSEIFTSYGKSYWKGKHFKFETVLEKPDKSL